MKTTKLKKSLKKRIQDTLNQSSSDAAILDSLQKFKGQYEAILFAEGLLNLGVTEAAIKVVKEEFEEIIDEDSSKDEQVITGSEVTKIFEALQDAAEKENPVSVKKAAAKKVLSTFENVETFNKFLKETNLNYTVLEVYDEKSELTALEIQ